MRRRVILGALAAAGTAAGVGAAVTPAGAATVRGFRVLNLVTDRPFVRWSDPFGPAESLEVFDPVANAYVPVPGTGRE